MIIIIIYVYWAANIGIISEGACDCWKFSFAITGIKFIIKMYSRRKLLFILFHNITIALYLWSNKCILCEHKDISFKNATKYCQPQTFKLACVWINMNLDQVSTSCHLTEVKMTLSPSSPAQALHHGQVFNTYMYIVSLSFLSLFAPLFRWERVCLWPPPLPSPSSPPHPLCPVCGMRVHKGLRTLIAGVNRSSRNPSPPLHTPPLPPPLSSIPSSLTPVVFHASPYMSGPSTNPPGAAVFNWYVFLPSSSS